MKQRMHEMKPAMGGILFWVITLGLFAIFFLSMKATVWGKEASMIREQLNAADSYESQLLSDVRDTLEKNGYRNCGITITKVYEQEGNWEYTVLIHHKRFEKCTPEQTDALLTQLYKLSFEVQQGVANYEIG